MPWMCCGNVARNSASIHGSYKPVIFITIFESPGLFTSGDLYRALAFWMSTGIATFLYVR